MITERAAQGSTVARVERSETREWPSLALKVTTTEFRGWC